MADYDKGFWYDTPYPAPTPEGVKLWKAAFNKHYPLNPVGAEETFCPSVYVDSKGPHYCTRKSNHNGIHREKAFATKAENNNQASIATLATWDEKDQAGLRGQVVATQEEPGNYYNPCTSTTKLVGSDKVTYVFRCENEDAHSGEHASEIYYSDAVPGYDFDSPNNTMSWTDGGKQSHKQLAGSGSKEKNDSIIASGKLYLAPVGTPVEDMVAQGNQIYHSGINFIPNTFNIKANTIGLSTTSTAMQPGKCLATLDDTHFCARDKGHPGYHKGNDFGWYSDDKNVTPLEARSKLIYQATQIKKDPHLPVEVGQTLQNIIDYLTSN